MRRGKGAEPLGSAPRSCRAPMEEGAERLFRLEIAGHLAAANVLSGNRFLVNRVDRVEDQSGRLKTHPIVKLRVPVRESDDDAARMAINGESLDPTLFGPGILPFLAIG